MKADLYSKISKYVLYGFAALIVVVFALFFCVGEPLTIEQISEATNERTELSYPKFTELSLYLCYAMFVITLLLVLVFETAAAIKNVMYSTAGLLKRVVLIVIVAAAVVGLYFISPDNVDFLIYLQYALFGIAALLMVGSLLISKMRS